jgi:hypothetical protein
LDADDAALDSYPETNRTLTHQDARPNGVNVRTRPVTPNITMSS